jgi:transglutaminase-like putative cysteine protease
MGPYGGASSRREPMSNIRVHSELHYTVHEPTSFLFAVLATRNRHQNVRDETVVTDPAVSVTRIEIDPSRHEILRVRVEPGPFSLRYDATVEVDALIEPHRPQAQNDFADLPPDVLDFLNPSRYCESDKLSRFVEHTFATLPEGFDRVTGICNWIYEHLDYVPGTTDASSTALDVLVQSAGVCRDYAHLGIALCRASGIPARYVSGYAVGLEPPDFHGFFEAYFGERWYLFDATRMASVDRLVRVATGRDAADASFATSVGSATLDEMHVSALDCSDAPAGDATTAAVSTASRRAVTSDAASRRP